MIYAWFDSVTACLFHSLMGHLPAPGGSTDGRAAAQWIRGDVQGDAAAFESCA